jgi:hypothetical protein
MNAAGGTDRSLRGIPRPHGEDTEAFAYPAMESVGRLPRAEIVGDDQAPRKQSEDDDGREAPLLKAVHTYTLLTPYSGARLAFTYQTTTRKEMPPNGQDRRGFGHASGALDWR